MKHSLFGVIFSVLLFAGCRSWLYDQRSDGIVVTLPARESNAARAIRLQVINDDIIRVSITPDKHFPETKSLMAVYEQTQTGGWSVQKQNDRIALQTATVTATVSLVTGKVSFSDNDGNLLLAENKGGGTSFSPIEVDGQKAYSLQQIFESPDDEAFYGLGQHQAGDFNYKGKNESLFQYNTKVAVPFILSSKNYGILWDNYSLTQFGDSRPYAHLDQFKLYDKNGNEGGLTASYFVDADAENRFTERIESQIDYENLETVKKFPPHFPFHHRSRIIWEGELEALETGRYSFILYYAGYITLHVDHQTLVPERWRTAWNPNSYKFTLDLKAGERRAIRLDWKPDGNPSYLGLKALSPRSEAEQNKLSLWSEMGQQIDYYFLRGNNPDGVIHAYRLLTGKSPIPPKWALGFWQSRERYKTQYEIVDALREYRQRNIPIDNIVQDWSYWPENAWGSHDFDPVRFPDPQRMIDSIHDLDARIMISVWPKFYHTTDHYKAFDAKGLIYNRAVKDSIRDWIGPGYIGGFYDAYSADARQLFWNQIHHKLYSKGIDAWWMDASEPDILSNADIAYRKKLAHPNALGSSTEYFNAYALMNAKGIYEGQRSTHPHHRVFQLTRSGYAGLQRYAAATWSGDIAARWEDLKAQIPAGLNYALSGIPYWTTDIGGFCVEQRYQHAAENSADQHEWRELNARWFQFGAFCPLFRSHGQYPYREIYHLSPEGTPTYRSMLHYTRLRYRLLPYLYSLAGMTYFDDYTPMRALIMDFAADKHTHRIGDQYLLGPSLMVCPVYTYRADSRPVYFPTGAHWYNYDTHQYHAGGQTQTIAAPYERIPLFVREGAIVPMGNDIQSTHEAQTDLTLKVYTGANGTFTLYEDENINYNYENGTYAILRFTYDDASKTLTLHDRQGQYPGMPHERTFRIEWITPHETQYTPEIRYDGRRLTLTMP
jgi:alpha-D-xyloside xylohydrolase